MSCVGSVLVTTIVSIGNKRSLGERIPKKFIKKIKIWHLLRGITLWTIWIERNGKVFNWEHWHDSKMKQLIWDDLIMYAKVAWARLVKYINISVYSTEGLLKEFNDTWGMRNVMCKRDRMVIGWN